MKIIHIDGPSFRVEFIACISFLVTIGQLAAVFIVLWGTNAELLLHACRMGDTFHKIFPNGSSS